MNIGNAYRRARNALGFEKPHFAVTVHLDNRYEQDDKYTRPCLAFFYFLKEYTFWIFVINASVRRF